MDSEICDHRQYKDLIDAFSSLSMRTCIKCVRVFLEKERARINRKFPCTYHRPHRCTPIMHASLRGELDMVQLLLDNGANPHTKNFRNCRPILYISSIIKHWCVRNCSLDDEGTNTRFDEYKKIIIILLQCGYQIDYIDHKPYKKWDDICYTKAFNRYCPDYNYTPPLPGNTALMYLLYGECFSLKNCPILHLASFLIENEADINFQNPIDGTTAFHQLFYTNRNKRMPDYENHKKIQISFLRRLDFFMKNGARYDIEDDDGYTVKDLCDKYHDRLWDEYIEDKYIVVVKEPDIE